MNNKSLHCMILFQAEKTQLWLALCLRLYHQIFNILIENLNFWQCSELKQRKIWKVLWFRKNDPNIRIHPEPELPDLPATNPLYPAMNDAVVFKYETGRGKLSPLITNFWKIVIFIHIKLYSLVKYRVFRAFGVDLKKQVYSVVLWWYSNRFTMSLKYFM